ncbi:dihydrolipoamide acetyltransferase family protein [Salinirussus salinus]|uniref:dihydrolipoamide acetyltransferase family protein n=1 Tax=Salinirussus salinus TaxID=1198300 RepID=UPI00135A1D36|nr:dihydrolipoamide acetyltransferase family protein [Salinirussus salinus]
MFEFALPDVGEGVSEGEVVAWHVEPGDRVAEDDVLAEVETDKAVVDLPAPVTGVVRELHAEVGDVVPVGEVVVTIEEDAEGGAEPEEAEAADGEEPAADPAGTAPGGNGTGGRVFAAPSVRRLARELGVDLAAVDGSGPGGRVVESDVRAAANAGGSDAEASPAGTSATEAGAASDGPAGGAGDGPTAAVTRRGDDSGAAAGGGTTPAETAGAADRDRTLAVPATRALADELGVDIDSVPTDKTREGEPFVDAEDVRAHAEAQSAAAEAGEASEAAGGAESGAGAGAGSTAGAEPAGIGPPAGEADTGGAAAAGERREPYRGIRRTIGERMAAADDAVPRATHHDSVVVTELVETRERLRGPAEERGVRLTYLPFVLKAVAAGLREHPVLNSRLDEEREEIVYHDAANVGVATATDDGLLVPVVERVGEKGVLELAAEVADLVERARARELSREEMQGGTFSVTNFGAVGGEYASPIVNHPETAILGLGELAKRPVVVDDEVVARHTLPLSLSIDHRVIDGADAARFANTVMGYLEEPSLLLLE